MAGGMHDGRLPVLACVLALWACASAGHEAGMDNDGTPEPGKRALVLDLEHREVAQPIGPELADPARQKFVRVQITDVHNPRRLRLTFDLRYRVEGREDVLLGTFGLYPPDNPRRFVVATRGELRKEGAVVLSMRILDEVGPADELRLAVKPLSFFEDRLPPTTVR
jgi:hypothetical protein